MQNSLDLINEAFSALQRHQSRFLACERAYKAVYKDHNRTSKLKSSQRSKSRLYVPLIKTTVQIIHSIFKTSFMSDRCPIEITRVGLRSDSDLVLQNALTAVLKNQWRKKQHKVGLSKAVLSALYLPLGAMSLYYDRSEKEIKTRFVPITDIAFDKHASDINDVEYVAYRWVQSTNEIKAKLKSGFYKIDKNENLNLDTIISRVNMRDIYEKDFKKGRRVWKLKSYANGILVREASFNRLPFHFGYCIEAMPSVDLETRTNENGVYGTCISEIAREVQEEYNIKRNQKIDITENLIDPIYFINKSAAATAISDIAMRNKFIRIDLAPNERLSDAIVPFTQPSSYPLSEEISMLKSEYEIITGVNSVMTGQTSPSDRRAMGALQVVNASSSVRIESMLQTLCETMLHSYAEHFVELIYKHTSDYELIKITEDPEMAHKARGQTLGLILTLALILAQR